MKTDMPAESIARGGKLPSRSLAHFQPFLVGAKLKFLGARACVSESKAAKWLIDFDMYFCSGGSARDDGALPGDGLHPRRVVRVELGQPVRRLGAGQLHGRGRGHPQLPARRAWCVQTERPKRSRFDRFFARLCVRRFPQRQHCAARQGSGGQLRFDGPDSRAPLDPAKYCPLWRRSRQRDPLRPWHRRRLHKFPHDLAHCHARQVFLLFFCFCRAAARNLQPELTLRLHKNGETRLAVYGVTAAPRPIYAKNILGVEIKIAHSQPISGVLRHLQSAKEENRLIFTDSHFFPLSHLYLKSYGTKENILKNINFIKKIFEPSFFLLSD